MPRKAPHRWEQMLAKAIVYGVAFAAGALLFASVWHLSHLPPMPVVTSPIEGFRFFGAMACCALGTCVAITGACVAIGHLWTWAEWALTTPAAGDLSDTLDTENF